jgi:Big-like domain-containing protein
MKTLRTLIAGALLSAGLVAAPLGRADPVDAYTATGSPTAVQPQVVSSYTITLTNDSGSPDSAAQATVSVPTGFSVTPLTLSAATSGVDPCVGSTWTPALSPDGNEIDVVSPDSGSGALCPGASLTIHFQATAQTADGTYAWTTHLQRASASFTRTNDDPSVVVDGTAPPAPTIDSNPPAASSSASASFSFSDSEPSVEFECRLDGEAFSSCTSPTSYNSLADGPHTFQVRARDGLGNTSITSDVSWTVDTVAPTVSLTSKPTTLTNDPTPTFGFSASEGGGTFACRLDSGSFASCTSGVTYPAQADGEHTFVVRAMDAAGNTGPETSYGWTIDTVAPSATLTSKPAVLTKDSTPSFAFTASEPGSTFECRLDSGSFGSCTSPKTYSGLTDGSHTFDVRATDPAGNAGAEATYNWTVDTVAPVATIGGAPPSVTDQTSVSFNLSSSEPGSTFECRLDSDSLASCASPKSYSGLAEGAHAFSIRATDSAGNVGAEAAYSWTVDTTNPVVTITSGPAAATNQTSASFTFSSEPGSTFECRLDAEAFAACPSPKNYPSLTDGAHNFRVRATDQAGNTGSTTTYSWTIDRTAPTVTLTSKPAALTNDPTPSFVFSASEGGSSFECKLDQAAFAACTSGITYAAQTDGSHTFVARATDAAGNVGPATSYGWTIDTVAPTATLTSKPLSPTNDPTPTFAFTASEPGSSLACRLDSGSFASCTSGITYAAQTDGDHTFAVRATDATGNTGPAATYTWTIDTAAPTATLTSTPTALTNDPTPSFAFTANEPGSTFSCRIDSGSFADCTSPKAYSTALADGSHTFRVRATDLAGNVGPASTYTWTIDTVAPTVTLTSKPATLTKDSTPTFTFTANESPSTFSCRLDSGSFAACTSPKDYSSLVDGSHTFRVRATDAAGNTGATAVHDWTIDTAAPTVTLTSKPAPVTDDTTPSFAFSASEPASTFSCKLDGGSSSACTSGVTYAEQANGEHTFVVKATDAATNTGPETTYTWTIDTLHPIVTISGPSTPTNQTSATLSFSSNKPGSTFQCRLDSGSFAACTSPKTYSSLPDGSHTFDVKATDPANNTGVGTRTWTVDTVAPPGPAIGGGPPAATNQTGATFAFSDGETVVGFSCRIDSATFAPCSNPKSYAGLADGPHTFAVRAQDAAGNLSSPSSYDWTVDTVAPDTAISSGPSLNSSSATASFTFASNEEGASFACSLDGGAFSPCTSPQTYGGLADGAHTLAARAIDSAGNVDPTPAPYAWTVLTPRAPDTTPPGRVSRLATAVGYGLVRLSWRLPPDADLDHVSVFVATTKRGPLQTVYTGKGTKFAYKRFRNGAYYRFAVVSYDHAGNHSVQARVAVGPSALLRSPRDGAVVRRPPLLSWVAVRGATYYNIQLVYAGRKVLSVWPKRTQLQLRGSWRYHGAHRLKKGRYTWFAWPGFGARAAARYGQLLGQGSFVVR